jgi:hypothetical protein
MVLSNGPHDDIYRRHNDAVNEIIGGFASNASVTPGPGDLRSWQTAGSGDPRRTFEDLVKVEPTLAPYFRSP